MLRRLVQIDDLLTKLNAARQTGRGWIACCPAHGDKNPSLSIREGERGILLRCFAGCSVQEICGALGITVRDLFFDQHADSRTIQAARRQREAERQKRDWQARIAGHKVDSQREAEQLIRSAREINISAWSDAQLDKALNKLADAYQLSESELLYERS